MPAEQRLVFIQQEQEIQELKLNPYILSSCLSKQRAACQLLYLAVPQPKMRHIPRGKVLVRDDCF